MTTTTMTTTTTMIVLMMLCVFVSVSDADVAVFSSNSGVTTPITRTFEPEEKLVQGLIQAGFPRHRAEAALRAVGNENCCQPQMNWLFEQSRATNAERRKPKSGQCNKQENTDYDGFAVAGKRGSLKNKNTTPHPTFTKNCIFA